MENEERLKAALADRYLIERELGAGGMATVYLAHDVKHDRKVAVKVLRPELASAVGPERFLRETRIAAKLQHPHILPLYDSGEADGFLFYVMPYVEGGSLRDRLVREGELPIEEAVRILRDVADALSEAHSLDLVHRDIKPENILLRGRHALVTDFGVAKAVSDAAGTDQLTTVGVALGTPAYMAPEQAAADAQVDHRADIYALGAVAYELLTGRQLFSGRNAQAILMAHVTETPEPITAQRETVSPALESLVLRCLEKKAADRWQRVEDLMPALEGLVTPSGGITPTDTRPLQGSPRSRPWLGRGVVGLTAVGVLAVLAVLVMRPWRGEEGAVPIVPVRLTANPIEWSVTGTAISPDGGYLAFVDLRGLHLQTLSSNEVHLVEMVPAIDPWRVWWYPSGDRLLILGKDTTGIQSLWSVSIFGGPLRHLITGVWDAAVSPQGDRIALIPGATPDRKSNREIWIMGASGSNPEVLVEADEGAGFWRVAWTPDGSHVAVGEYGSGTRISLVSVPEGTTRTLFSGGSLFQDWTGPLPFRWCGESTLIFSQKDGPSHQVTSNVWAADIDVSRAEARREPRRVTQWAGANVREMSVTPDCSRIVVLQVRNQADAAVAELDAAGTAFTSVQKLTFDERPDYPLGWAPDGSGFLMMSSRLGDMDLFFRSLEADGPELIQGGSGAQRSGAFSPDGEMVLYRQGGEIWTVPYGGGAARMLSEGPFRDLRCVPEGDVSCVVASFRENRFVFHSLDPETGQVIELASTERRPPFNNFDLSPDGTKVAVVHGDNNEIQVVDLLSGDETTISVEDWSSFEFISWTAQGDGFFINAGFSGQTEFLAALLHVDMEGRARRLLTTPSEWHVYIRASPDGRHVAFASMPFHGNAWLIEDPDLAQGR
jgi:Tol biopolymer transport system component/tRNA A-37 threonylcarbamoyl transferase component Bud32